MEFRRRFDAEPTLWVRSPGRVNLIGEHVDYNDGLVLPFAIDRSIHIAARPTGERTIRVYSAEYDEEATIHLDELVCEGSHWSDHFRAAGLAALEVGRTLHGWEGVVAGDVPVGAGLSSSSALGLAIQRVHAMLGQWHWQPLEMAQLARTAEARWFGTECGIMDQFVIAAGQSGYALFIDCRTLERTLVKIPTEVVVMVMDSGTRREVCKTAYSERRVQCRAVAEMLGVPSLRELSLQQLETSAKLLEPVALRRTRHVITEIERTVLAVESLNCGDVRQLGRLLDASHRSLRDDFEVSTPAIDALVAIARREPGCYGARLTGAGFGGCAIALVQARHQQVFAQSVSGLYRRQMGVEIDVYPCRPSDGVTGLAAS